jgi:hypothetical protein
MSDGLIAGTWFPVNRDLHLQCQFRISVPETSSLHWVTGSASHLAGLEDLTHLVIDEADRMVQPGHFEVRLTVLPLKYSSLRPA